MAHRCAPLQSIFPPVILPCPAHSRRGSEESVLPSFPVILSTAKNPYSCRRPSFLSVQKGCKDTPEGEDSESLPPLDSPHSNGQKGVPFWISPCEREDRQGGRILRLHLCYAQNDENRKTMPFSGRAEALPGQQRFAVLYRSNTSSCNLYRFRNLSLRSFNIAKY